MWEDLGGTSLDKPKVVSARDNRLDIFTKVRASLPGHHMDSTKSHTGNGLLHVPPLL